MKTIYKRTTGLVYVINIIFWMSLFVYYSFIKYSGSEEHTILKMILFMEPLAFTIGLIGYLRKNQFILRMTIVFLVANSILSITDEVGLFDLISLLLNVVLLIILMFQWKNRFDFPT